MLDVAFLYPKIKHVELWKMKICCGGILSNTCPTFIAKYFGNKQSYLMSKLWFTKKTVLPKKNK